MLKLSHKTLIILSGLIWMAVGCFLLPLGLNFLLEAIYNSSISGMNDYPLLHFFSSFVWNAENAVIVLIAIGMMIGYAKGRYVLGKSAVRGVERILSFPNPTSLANIYSTKYYLLLGAMIGLGMSMKYLGLPKDVRGLVDVAIGAALINGAMIYFRLAIEKTAKAK